MSNFRLTKLINNNISKSCILASNIQEFDIEHAHTTAIRYIMGEAEYERLMAIPYKLERNIEIGKMRKKNPQLTNQIQDLILSWFNMFIEANDVKERNFLATTPDSVLLYNKYPTVTKFDGGKINFRNKEKIVYTSLFYITNRGNDKIILFDRMSKRVRIKGIGEEEETNKYPFINRYLKNLLCVLEDSVSIGRTNSLIKLRQMKLNYFNNINKEIFRSINDKNAFHYIIDDTDVLVDNYIEETDKCILIKTDNYMNYILPLIQIMI